jgi:dTDP-4-dehydrorhamnose reductase
MKILLFGATGMLGKYVDIVLKDNYKIHCISRDNYDIENDSITIEAFIKIKTISREEDDSH